MSKLYDVEKIYGQDFGIAVTNAPSYIVSNSKNLMKNIILISSPQDSTNDADKGQPALFVTDYEGSPVQLTYPIKTAYNGLSLDDKEKYLYISIDDNTIKSREILDDGTEITGLPLYVNTLALSYATLNDSKGVVNVADKINIERDEDIFGKKTDTTDKTNLSGISIDPDGYLYIPNNFITLLSKYIQSTIEDKIKPLAKNTQIASFEISNESVILYAGPNEYQAEAISNNVDNGFYNIKKMTFNFTSESDKPIEGIKFPTISGNMLIKIDGKTEGTSTVDPKPYLELDEYKQYSHHIKNIEAIIYPNYNIINNQFVQSTNAFKIEGIKDNEDNDIVYRSVSFTQASMNTTSDTGFLFKLNMNRGLNLNYSIANNIITMTFSWPIIINYRSLVSYNKPDKKYEPIQYTYDLYIGSTKIYSDTLEPNENLDIKQISIDQNTIQANYSLQLNEIKDNCVRNNGGAIQILSSASSYNKLYAVLNISIPGNEPYIYTSNTISITHKNMGSQSAQKFDLKVVSLGGSPIVSDENNQMSLNNTSNYNALIGIFDNIKNSSNGIITNTSIQLNYLDSTNSVVMNSSFIKSIIFNGPGTNIITINNETEDELTGDSTFTITKNFNSLVNYSIQTVFDKDHSHYNVNNYNFNLHDLIENRLKNLVVFYNSPTGTNKVDGNGASTIYDYIYIRNKYQYDSNDTGKTIDVQVAGTGVTTEDNNYKIQVPTDNLTSVNIICKIGSTDFTFNKELPIYQLGEITSINFGDSNLVPTDNGDIIYRIDYEVYFTVNKTGGYTYSASIQSGSDIIQLEEITKNYIKVKVLEGQNGNATIQISCEGSNGTVNAVKEFTFNSSISNTLNSISLPVEDIVINVGETKTLTLTTDPSEYDGEFTWTISNSNKVSIIPNRKSCTLQGIEETEGVTLTVIPVGAESKQIEKTIKVYNNNQPSITLSCNKNAIESGESANITVIYNNYEDLTPTIMWSIYPINYIGISNSTNDGCTITADENIDTGGEYTITATDQTNSLTATYSIILSVEGSSTVLQSFAFEDTTDPIDIAVGSQKTIRLSCNPSNTTEQFNWTISDNTKATITPSADTQSCEVTGNSITDLPITLTVGPTSELPIVNKTKQINIIAQSGPQLVKSISLVPLSITLGRSDNRTIFATLDNCSGTLTWLTDVLGLQLTPSVDTLSCVVSTSNHVPNSNGTITATLDSDSTISNSVTVTISNLQ